MSIYEESSNWDWRFGQTPDFKNSIEHKFDWALIDVSFNVEKGRIVEAQVFSDCLIPAFIDAVNEELATGEITYDVSGVESLCKRVHSKFEADSAMDVVRDTYLPQF